LTAAVPVVDGPELHVLLLLTDAGFDAGVERHQ